MFGAFCIGHLVDDLADFGYGLVFPEGGVLLCPLFVGDFVLEELVVVFFGLVPCA